MLMLKIYIARRLVVDNFLWCNANFVPFPSGTLVARRMQNGRIAIVVIKGYAKGYVYIFEQLLRQWLDLLLFKQLLDLLLG